MNADEHRQIENETGRRVYYNEIDADLCRWLRNLIAAGLIPQGRVDDRSITDVKPTDLDRYVQCHFFAGVAGWPLALRLAGWPDDRRVWTASLPCQPWSSAGKRRGRDDDRHLWPAFLTLVQAAHPAGIIGEQVASSEVVGTQLEAAFVVAVQRGDFARANKLAKQLAHGHALHYWPRWLDGIRSDLAKEGYTFWTRVLGAHSVGAPHIRQRLFWMADHQCHGLQRAESTPGAATNRRQRSAQHGDAGGMAQPDGAVLCGQSLAGQQPIDEPNGGTRRLDDPPAPGREGRDAELLQPGQAQGRQPGRSGDAGGVGHPNSSGSGQVGSQQQGRHPASSPWSHYRIIPCADGEHRRINAQSGDEPLADGIPAKLADLLPRLGELADDPGRAKAMAREARRARRVMLRAWGNAINPYVAAAFVRECLATGRTEEVGHSACFAAKGCFAE